MKKLVFMWIVMPLLIAACGPKRIQVALSVPVTQGGGPSLAGAAIVDITPPLGPSLYGHGPNSPPAQGHRGRLFCRAIYLEDPRGEAVALVTCDLQSISVLLQHRLAAEVRARTGLGMDRLLVSATHTHAGPAHYFGARSYSGDLSSQRPGFDPRMVAFLSRRITTAIVQARQRAKGRGPARVAWLEGRVPLGTTRNSSLDPHCGNLDPLPGEKSSCGQPNVRPDALLEVDRLMTVLRVERIEGGAWKVIAIHATFAMHPTVVDNLNTLFHADAFGVATRLAEGALNVPGALYSDEPVVVALANGHAGDVMANVHKQGFDEAQRIGEILGETLISVARAEAEPTEVFEIRRAFGIYPLASAPVVVPGLRPTTPLSKPPPPVLTPASADERLCKRAELGNPTAGGAEDGRTAFYYSSAYFQEGARDPDRGDACHRPRISWESLFKKLTFARHGFPDRAPLQIVRVADRALVAVPGELTTTAGLALQRALGQRLGRAVRVVGYANGYLQYLTTRQEFLWQYYQGASNLWGPGTLAFVWNRLARLVDRDRATAASPEQAIDLAEPSTPFRLPSSRRRLPRPLAPDSSPPRLLWSRPLVPGGGFELLWRGISPSATHPDADRDGLPEALPPRVRIERCDTAGSCTPLLDAHKNPVDDRSIALSVRYLGRRPPKKRLPGAEEPARWQLHDASRRPRKRDKHYWQATWYAEGALPGRYRIAVLDARGQVRLASEVDVP